MVNIFSEKREKKYIYILIYFGKKGARYRGHYEDNKKNGRGFFIYPDGSK